MKTITLSQIQNEAKILQDTQNITYNQSLQIIAQKNGFKSYQAILNQIKKDYIDDENEEIKEFKVRIENEYKNVNIVFINYSMEDLTPEFIINNKIYTIIMYHGLEWLNKQVGLLNIVKNPLLNRELIVPALVDNLAIDKANKKLFEELSKRMGTILTLQFVDARYFSPERLEK